MLSYGQYGQSNPLVVFPSIQKYYAFTSVFRPAPVSIPLSWENVTAGAEIPYMIKHAKRELGRVQNGRRW
jgi:hypothetical protein